MPSGKFRQSRCSTCSPTDGITRLYFTVNMPPTFYCLHHCMYITGCFCKITAFDYSCYRRSRKMSVLKSATFILLLVFCDALAMAAKCGRLSHKASFRKQNTFLSPNAIDETCRYRIRAPNGLHISLSANIGNFTVYDASKKPFRWRQNQILKEITEPKTEHDFETRIIGIMFKGTSLNTQIGFAYKATIPQNNDFGFTTFASVKEKVIRTPGFPKVPLGSGIKSTWTIKSKDNKKAILLVVQGLRTASDRDYVEVYDGDRVLGRISKRLHKSKPKPQLLALSGSMKIYFNTETPGSKGFKATYKIINVNYTVIAEPEYTGKGSLQCHNRRRVMSHGGTVSDVHSTISCTPGLVCGRMRAEVMEENSPPGGVPLVNERMNCIPESLCHDTKCQFITPHPEGATRLSCALTCCSTNMCNRSPDGPDVPPLTEEEANRIESSGLGCFVRSEIDMGESKLGDASDGHVCNLGEICALYIFEGIAINLDGSRRPGSGYAAKCEFKSNCTQKGCRDIEQKRYIDIESCEVKCCDTEKCNRPPGFETVVSPPSTGEGEGIDCNEQSELSIGEENIGSASGGKTCNRGEICALYVYEGTSLKKGVEINGNGFSAQCELESRCNQEGCRAIRDSQYINITLCDVTCCKTRDCNNPPIDWKPLYLTPGRLQCHERNRVMSNGVTLRDVHSTTTCPPEHSCGRVQVEVKSENLPEGVTHINERMNCIPNSLCNDTKCQTMPHPEGTTRLSCALTCCSTNMCNRSPDGPDVPPQAEEERSLQCHNRNRVMSHGGTVRDVHSTISCTPGHVCGRMRAEVMEENTPPGGVPSGTTECYDIMSTRADGIPGINNRTIARCSSLNSRCARIDVVGTDPSGSRVLSSEYGSCIHADACSSLDCSVLESGMIGLTIQSCKASCCNTNLCNAFPGEPMPELPPLVESGNEKKPRRLQCHDRNRVMSNGATLRDVHSTISCPPEHTCGRMLMEVKSENLPEGVSHINERMNCIPKSLCNDKICQTMPHPEGTTRLSCALTCCSTNMCNRSPDGPDVPPRTEEEVGTTECYDIMSTSVDGIPGINNRTIASCPSPNSRCSRIDVVGTDPSGSRVLSSEYGSCIPAEACSSLDCSVLESGMIGLTIQSCKASCCDTNLCNAFSGEPMPELPPLVESGNEKKPRIHCYEMLDVKASGISLPVTEKREKKLCDPGYQCMKMAAVASFNRHPAMKVTTIAGSCQPSILCSSIDCSSMPSPMPDVTVESCETSCCDTDLCNK